MNITDLYDGLRWALLEVILTTEVSEEFLVNQPTMLMLCSSSLLREIAKYVALTGTQSQYQDRAIKEMTILAAQGLTKVTHSETGRVYSRR